MRVSVSSSTLPWIPWTGGPSPSSIRSTSTRMKSPACRIASAARSCATHSAGSARVPRGMWVSEMIARRIDPNGKLP